MANKKISDLAAVATAALSDFLALETASGTKKITFQNFMSVLTPKTAAAHNAIFRGKDLTGVYTIAQISAMITAGTFDDLYIGDYFDVTISTTYTASEVVRCVFAGFDTFMNNGDTALSSHHAAIVTKNCFAATAKMNSTNTTGVSQNTDNPVGVSAEAANQKGAYYGSDMNQIVLPVYAAALQTALSNHIVTRRALLSDKIGADLQSNAGAGFTGASSNWAWYDTKLSLLSEMQVYGGNVLSSSFYDTGCDNQQLPLFALDPTAKVCGAGGTGSGGRQWYWLKNVASAAYFAFVSSFGASNYDLASHSSGVRPLFVIR